MLGDRCRERGTRAASSVSAEDDGDEDAQEIPGSEAEVGKIFFPLITSARNDCRGARAVSRFLGAVRQPEERPGRRKRVGKREKGGNGSVLPS